MRYRPRYVVEWGAEGTPYRLEDMVPLALRAGLHPDARPGSYQSPWDLVFAAHRNDDVKPGYGPVRLKAIVVTRDAGCVPLYHWSEEEIWEYHKIHSLPVDTKKYDNQINHQFDRTGFLPA